MDEQRTKETGAIFRSFPYVGPLLSFRWLIIKKKNYDTANRNQTLGPKTSAREDLTYTDPLGPRKKSTVPPRKGNLSNNLDEGHPHAEQIDEALKI